MRRSWSLVSCCSASSQASVEWPPGLLDTLPPWLHINGDRLQIDLAALLRHYDAAEALSYIRRVAITARKGAMILALDAQIPLNDVKYRATRTRVLTC